MALQAEISIRLSLTTPNYIYKTPQISAISLFGFRVQAGRRSLRHGRRQKCHAPVRMSHWRIVRIEVGMPIFQTRRIILVFRDPAVDSPDQVNARALLQQTFYLHLSYNFIKLLLVIYDTVDLV